MQYQQQYQKSVEYVVGREHGQQGRRYHGRAEKVEFTPCKGGTRTRSFGLLVYYPEGVHAQPGHDPKNGEYDKNGVADLLVAGILGHFSCLRHEIVITSMLLIPEKYTRYNELKSTIVNVSKSRLPPEICRRNRVSPTRGCLSSLGCRSTKKTLTQSLLCDVRTFAKSLYVLRQKTG